MRTRLDQYTMAEFIDIVSGDESIIGAETPESAHLTAASLATQYREIANPAQAKSLIVEEEENGKFQSKLTIIGICLNLISVFKDYDSVREILKVGNIYIGDTSDERIEGSLQAFKRKTEAQMKRKIDEASKENETSEETDLRSAYDKQTAYMMTYFKMNIDHRTISASIYANLVNIAYNQSKK